MSNSVISQITLPSGTTYDLKDAQARNDIAELKNITSGAMFWLGISTTSITDGGKEKPTINNVQITLGTDDAGAVCGYGNLEFAWNGTTWQEFGSTGSLKALAFKESASGSYTPAGTVSKPTFTGGDVTSTGKFTPKGSVTVGVRNTSNKTATVSPAASGTTTYTPAGSVTAPTISVKTAGTTAKVTPISGVGTLPSFSATVSNETLTLGFSQGTLPTKGTDITVKTGDAAYEATAPAFTGTGVCLVTGNIPVPSTFTGSFTGTEGDVSVIGTSAGEVSQPSFSGTNATITVS